MQKKETSGISEEKTTKSILTEIGRWASSNRVPSDTDIDSPEQTKRKDIADWEKILWEQGKIHEKQLMKRLHKNWKKKWMLHSLSLSIPAESPLPKSLHGAASVLRRCRIKYSSLAFRNGARGPLSQGAYGNQVWSFMVQINSAGLCISQILNWNDINLLCHINMYRMKSMEIPRRYNISWFPQPEAPHRQPGEPRPQVTKRFHTQKGEKMEGPPRTPPKKRV